MTQNHKSYPTEEKDLKFRLIPPLVQFSQMMLVYMGLAADIAEVFEAFRESKVCSI